MPVSELLAVHTSRELTEWMAYERAYGPLDSAWRDSKIAEIHELLQSLIHVEANAHSDGKSSDTKPQDVVRPNGLWKDFMKRRNRGEFD